MSYGNAYYPGYLAGMGSRPRLQSMHPFRHMVAAGTNMNGAWTGGGGGGGGSGHSGYGPEPPDYDYHSGPPAQVPSGGSYSYHSTAGTGYGVPPANHQHPQPHPHPHPHPPAQPPAVSGGDLKKGLGGGGGKKGSSSSSTMTALTLLSFFFFVNLLQGCIKDHMDYMNPTVMVMTTDIRKRNNFNKMGEMNSREQSSAVASSNLGSSTNIVMQPADMLASAAMNSAKVMEAMKPFVNLQSPYSGITGSVQRPVDVSAAPPQQLAPPVGPVVTQYQSHNPETEVQYHKPYYDPHQPDVYEHQHHHQHRQPDVYEHHHHHHHAPAAAPPQYNPPQYQTPVINENPYNNQQPPIYMGSAVEHHHYSNVNSDYHYPSTAPAPQAAAPPSPQYSTTRNPLYEHQHPPAHTYKDDHHGSQQYLPETPHKYPQHYDDANSHNPQGPVPWSSHSSSSSSSSLSSSVVSGPFRRATIVSVSPTIKWISVPSNVDDHTDFGADDLDGETNRNHRYSESSHYRKFP